MLNMACTFFRLTPEEALRGVTVHGARALGLHDRGTLQAGQRADFVVWDLEHPNELAYWFGRNPCRRIVVGGIESHAMKPPIYILHHGRTPLLVSLPHAGTVHPAPMLAAALRRARARSRTPTGSSTGSTPSSSRWGRA